jgi:hypothetical protein
MPRKSRRRIRSHNRSLRKPLRKNTRRRRTRRSHNRSLRKPLRKNMRGGMKRTQIIGTGAVLGDGAKVIANDFVNSFAGHPPISRTPRRVSRRRTSPGGEIPRRTSPGREIPRRTSPGRVSPRRTSPGGEIPRRAWKTEPQKKYSSSLASSPGPASSPSPQSRALELIVCKADNKLLRKENQSLRTENQSLFAENQVLWVPDNKESDSDSDVDSFYGDDDKYNNNKVGVMQM